MRVDECYIEAMDARLFLSSFLAWAPLAMAITGSCALVQVTVQQNYRQLLNDPQIQMVEDAVQALEKGEVPAAVVPRTSLVDLRRSLAPWIAVYDRAGKPLESSGFLDNASAQPPKGVFDDVAAGISKASGASVVGGFKENRISWQPVPDVRQAIVVAQLKGGGFVVAGRNMREVEDREGKLGEMIFLGWLVSLISTFIAQLIGVLLSARLRRV